MDFTADELEALATDMDSAAALFLKLVPRIRAAAKALRRAKASPGSARTRSTAKKATAKKPVPKKVKRAVRKGAKKAKKDAAGASKKAAAARR